MLSDPSHLAALSVSSNDGSSSSRLPVTARNDDGFSLIELLVVILVIGILAAIAIPSFLNSKGKAIDAQAKELARTAETTAETIATANDGSYEKVSKLELVAEEPTIRTTASPTDAYVSSVTSSKNEYAITTTATNGDEFTITKSSSGSITRACASPVRKTGCLGGESSTW